MITNIEIGKFYKTRDGRKAAIFMLNGDEEDGLPVLGAIQNIYVDIPTQTTKEFWDLQRWTKNGERLRPEIDDPYWNRMRAADLIEEWCL